MKSMGEGFSFQLAGVCAGGRRTRSILSCKKKFFPHHFRLTFLPFFDSLKSFSYDI